jgi:hypothetical protein
MNLHIYKNWIFSIFAITILAAGAGYLITGDSYSNQLEVIQFSDLTDADVDLILAVKAEMHTVTIQSN